MLGGVPPALADGEIVAAFHQEPGRPHFEGVRAGVEQMVKKMNAKVPALRATKPNNIAEGMAQLEDVGVTKPGYRAVHAARPQGAVADRPEADRGGHADRQLQRQGRRPRPMSRSSARTTLSWGSTSRQGPLFDHLGGKGNVVILEGIKGSNTGDERKRGFDEAAKQYPGIKVLARSRRTSSRCPDCRSWRT